jgi:NADH-quinone oxidoreductase subunit A
VKSLLNALSKRHLSRLGSSTGFSGKWLRSSFFLMSEGVSSVSDFLRSYLTVAWFGLTAVLLAALLLWVSSLIRPSRPGREKLLTYESGVDPVGEGWSQSQVRYYIFALLFVVFDVEAVFIFPWATQLERYGTFGLVEMGIFVFVLLLGLVYAWRKGVLRWV